MCMCGASFGFRPNIRSIDRTYRSVASSLAAARARERELNADETDNTGAFENAAFDRPRVVLYVGRCRALPARERIECGARASIEFCSSLGRACPARRDATSGVLYVENIRG